jgi:hypothetical protein
MPNQAIAARTVNIVLGVWLFISAFLWPHGQGQFTNTWLVGLLCAAFAVVATWAPQVRYLNTILAIWLFISAWAIPSVRSATIWNNALVSIAMLVASLIPSLAVERGARGVPPPRI